jgi:hypothetical protein
MKRRTFLAGMGFGVSSLLLPSLARAHGFRRRRCEPICGYGPPNVLSGCPLSQYGQAGGIYYYHCLYNDTCQNPVDCSSTRSIQCPQSCPDGTCIPVGLGRPSSYSLGSPPPDTSFYPSTQQHYAGGGPAFATSLHFNPTDPSFCKVNEIDLYYNVTGGPPRYFRCWQVGVVNKDDMRVGLELDMNPGGALQIDPPSWTDGFWQIVKYDGKYYHLIARSS